MRNDTTLYADRGDVFELPNDPTATIRQEHRVPASAVPLIKGSDQGRDDISDEQVDGLDFARGFRNGLLVTAALVALIYFLS